MILGKQVRAYFTVPEKPRWSQETQAVAPGMSPACSVSSGELRSSPLPSHLVLHACAQVPVGASLCAADSRPLKYYLIWHLSALEFCFFECCRHLLFIS